VAIEKAGVIVHLPQALETNQIQKTCYTGTLGSRVSDCQSNIVDSQRVSFSANNTLAARQDLTVVLGWPKGIVAVQKPISSPTTKFITLGLWSLILPVLVFALLFYLWYKRGRDPRGRGTIIPQYEPPDNLQPGAMGVVLDEKADLKDISSTIIDLAVKGYMKIKQIKTKKLIGESTDYEFIKLKGVDDKLTNYEKRIFDGIFGISNSEKLSDLKNEFYVNLKNIKDDMYNLVTKRLFSHES
jgi:hypothetical protein